MKEKILSGTPLRRQNLLWKYRKRMGFTQGYVARLLGQQSSAHISQWENGRSNPDRLNTIKLSIIYRVPSEFLFREEYLALRKLIRKREERLIKAQERHEDS